MATLQNEWQYGVRVSNVHRDLLPELQRAFNEVEFVDPREKLRRATDDASVENVTKRWPDLDLLRIIVTVDDGFKPETLLSFLETHQIGLNNVDLIIGVTLETQSEYSALPAYLLNAIRKLPCEVTFNATVM